MKILHLRLEKYSSMQLAIDWIQKVQTEGGESKFLGTSKETAEKLFSANECTGKVFWIDIEKDWFVVYKLIGDQGRMFVDDDLYLMHEHLVSLNNFNKKIGR